ncbi:MAG: DUF6790 family protein [Vulcanimicrobiaceae bacterium]
MTPTRSLVLAITALLGNLGTLLFVVALIVAFVKLRRARVGRRVVTWPYLFWGELLFYGVGLSMVYVGLLHAFAQPIAARSIGWEASPFEWELGWAEIGLGVAAMMSLWRGYNTRLTVTIIFAIFSLGAAVQHINQIRCCGNYAPGNAGLILWLGDIALPLILLVLAAFSRDAYERKVRW